MFGGRHQVSWKAANSISATACTRTWRANLIDRDNLFVKPLLGGDVPAEVADIVIRTDSHSAAIWLRLTFQDQKIAQLEGFDGDHQSRSSRC